MVRSVLNRRPAPFVPVTFALVSNESRPDIVTPAILVVDDERNLRKLVRVCMENEGYRVVEATDGQEALFAARRQKPDLVLLDPMMPHMGGYDFIRRFTPESDAPVVILIAKIEESDKVAVLGRAGRPAHQPDLLRSGEISLNRTGLTVQVGHSAVDLTLSEFELPKNFMLPPGRAFSRLDLRKAICPFRITKNTVPRLQHDWLERTLNGLNLVNAILDRTVSAALEFVSPLCWIVRQSGFRTAIPSCRTSSRLARITSL